MDNRHSTRKEDVAEQTYVYLVRHGETEWNRSHRFQGQLDVPLSEVGRKQAEAVADWLARQSVNFTAIYTSDLKRASQTAQAIGDRLGITPQPARALREIHVGEWQGLSVDEVEAGYPGQINEWADRVDSFTLPGGESIPQVQERVFAFYRKVTQQHDGQAIIVVSHGAALAALIAAIHNWELVETWRTRRARMGNTGVTAISIECATGNPNILLLNSSEHLPAPTGIASVLDRRSEIEAH
ncbi:MAG: histidine phosphatase family protein [Chloroflexi bacterium]|nr:histidine phosphatase family protein [Chloroflexota bacterium]